MVDMCPVVKWSSTQMVVWKLDWKNLYMVQNVRYSNSTPSQMTLPFEYPTPILSSIQVFSIQMVTVLTCNLLPRTTIADNPKTSKFDVRKGWWQTILSRSHHLSTTVEFILPFSMNTIASFFCPRTQSIRVIRDAFCKQTNSIKSWKMFWLQCESEYWTPEKC